MFLFFWGFGCFQNTNLYKDYIKFLLSGKIVDWCFCLEAFRENLYTPSPQKVSHCPGALHHNWEISVCYVIVWVQRKEIWRKSLQKEKESWTQKSLHCGISQQKQEKLTRSGKTELYTRECLHTHIQGSGCIYTVSPENACTHFE